mmetsp:Transcript_37922/g.55902  ORF Transcript_37922/g.55902 Transcript_37922/m.55902 type:complete len:360 (+) Transcript_37922:136-1215(+)
MAIPSTGSANKMLHRLPGSVSITEGHHDFLLVLGFLLGCGGSGFTTSSNGRRSVGGSERGRIGEVGLDVGGSVEGEADLVVDHDAEKSTDGRTDGVGHGRGVGNADGERNSSNVAGTLGEGVDDVVAGDVEDLGREDVSVVEDLKDVQTVGERADAELLEKIGLTGSHTVTGGDQSDLTDDLDLTLGNLGGDFHSLEIAGLGGIATGRARGDNDVGVSNDTGTGRGGDGVLGDDGLGGGQVVLDEDEADVADDLLDEGVVGGVLAKAGEDLAHHGVLAHEDVSGAAHGLTDVLELLGTNVVSVDDEALGVLGQESLHEGEVLFFACAGRHLERLGFLRKKKEKKKKRIGTEGDCVKQAI